LRVLLKIDLKVLLKTGVKVIKRVLIINN